MSRRHRPFLVVFVAAAVVATAVPAGAADPRSKAVVDKAIAFIASQQNPDGGFGDAPDTETPDAALAIDDTESFNRWIFRLEAAASRSISNFEQFLEALAHNISLFESKFGEIRLDGAQPFTSNEPSN